MCKQTFVNTLKNCYRALQIYLTNFVNNITGVGIFNITPPCFCYRAKYIETPVKHSHPIILGGFFIATNC